jgi:hypothetical protein
MNPALPDNAVMLPSDFERQQIFYWLKRVSSVTAWRRIIQYHKAWADATENSLREAEEHGLGDETSLPQSEYALILKCQAHCEEAVSRLSKGDKRVFKYDANGQFEMGGRMLSHWSQMLYRIEIGENGINKHTPRWPEFCAAATSAAQAWGECGPHILEPYYLDEPALILYGVWMQEHLPAMPFPKELPAVPDPTDNKFVRTNSITPCTGIWEPVDLPKRSFISLLTGAEKPQPPFRIVGSMNYLHGGSRAPRITVETADDSFDLHTTWRLLWRDDRYEDGTIPEEEALYRFNKPDAVQPPAPPIWYPDQTYWTESGKAAAVGGKWLLESDLDVSIILNKGDLLPMHQGREVRWVSTAS